MTAKEAGQQPQLTWIEAEAGRELRILFSTRPEALSAEAWHQIDVAYARMSRIVATLVTDRDGVETQERTVEGALTFLANHMNDITSFFEVLSGDLSPTGEGEFPFSQ